MGSEPPKKLLTSNEAMKRVAQSQQLPVEKTKALVPTSLKSGTRVGQVYWCEFSHTNMLPEFDDDHLVMIIKSGKLDDVSLVVPLTKKPQGDNPHGYELAVNANPQTAGQSWAVCDHVYAVAAPRLRPLRNQRNEVRTPFSLDDEDVCQISKRVFRVLSPFLQRGVAPADAQPSGSSSP